MTAKQCRHEAWEESAHSRKCADCGQWLEPAVDFQVGDRVSVEGVVAKATGKDGHAWVDSSTGERYRIWHEDLTLVERPKRKLRVGSVWERPCTDGGEVCACGKSDRYLWTGVTFVSPNGDNYSRESRDFDKHPNYWREVPVEELEAE